MCHVFEERHLGGGGVNATQTRGGFPLGLCIFFSEYFHFSNIALFPMAAGSGCRLRARFALEPWASQNARVSHI